MINLFLENFGLVNDKRHYLIVVIFFYLMQSLFLYVEAMSNA